jgi:uncharacterized membrane protein
MNHKNNNTMNKINLILILMLTTVFVKCVKHKAAEVVVPCDASKVYYSNDIQPLLNSNCAMSGCHDSKTKAEGYDFSNYNATMKSVTANNLNSSELYKVIQSKNGSAKMPPKNYPALSSSQVALISTWIMDGAKNNKCISTATCDTTNILFSTTVNNIISNNCVGCHNASSAAGGVNLSTFSGVNAEATSGKLLNTINYVTGYKPMPPSSQLNNCDRLKIEQWIKKGSKNN